MSLIVIEGDVQDRSFSGHRLAGPVDTRYDRRGQQRARWVTGELYGKDDGGYVLAVVNWSLVWHVPDGESHVRRPRRIAPADLDPDAVYCGVMPVRPDRGHCPVHWGDGGNRVTDPFRRQEMALPPFVVTELPQRKVTECRDYPSLIEEMSTFRKRGATSVAISEPMARLLEEAAETDPVFRQHSAVPL